MNLVLGNIEWVSILFLKGTNMNKICKICGYIRVATDIDIAPEFQCPKCGTPYGKEEEYLKQKYEDEQRIKAEQEKKQIEKNEKEKEQKQTKDALTRVARKRVVTKTFKGSPESATAAFQAHAAEMAEAGYYPTSQTWAPGTYGCGEFLIALILCVIVIGIIVFLYMLIVKPEGTLSVTYELRELPKNTTDENPNDSKVCPRCAETIKAKAVVCRYCGHEFETK